MWEKGVCFPFVENNPWFYVMFKLQVTIAAKLKRGFPAGGEFQPFSTNNCVLKSPRKSAVESGCQVVPKATPRWRTFEESAQDSASIMLLGVI